MRFAILIVLSLPICTFISAQVTPVEAIADMNRGINLGNSLEAAPTETSWGNPPIEEYYFDMYADAGFTAVRVPVRWDLRTSEAAPYAVDAVFMDRVEQVVDWGLQRDLYIVINAHHEEWIKSNYEDPAYRTRFDSIWSQIAVRFADKQDKLIFEIINEPHGLTKEQNDDLHARVLSIIRRTNPTRLVIFQGHNWGGSNELIEAAIPDPEDEYLIGSFHSYDPWPFGLEGTGTFGSQNQINTLDAKFSAVKSWSDDTGIPVILGEFGCHKDADYMSRMRHYQTYMELAGKYGFCPCAWDDGGNFRIMQRSQHDWNQIKDILIYGSPESPGYPNPSVYQDTIIKITWTNRTGDAENIIIQRSDKPDRGFTDIASLDAKAEEFLDPDLEQNRTYYYRVIASNVQEEDHYSHPVMIYLPFYVPSERLPFGGDPAPIPGIIEAEDFDHGGEGVAYHDADDRNITGDYRPGEGVDIYDRLGDGYHIGNFLPGEWLEYTIDASQSGVYKITIHTASQLGGGSLKLSVGESSSGQIIVPSTGSSLTTDTVSVTMEIPSGEQVVRATCMSTPSFNLDKLGFELLEATGGTNVLSHERNATKGSLLLFRDPNGTVICRMPAGQVARKAEWFDLSGKHIRTEHPCCDEFVLPSGGLPEGIFILKVFSERDVFIEKVLYSPF